MRITGTPVIARPAIVRAQAPAAPVAQPRVRAAEGPPPEYSLWSMLKDIGSRIGDFFRNLF